MLVADDKAQRGAHAVVGVVGVRVRVSGAVVESRVVESGVVGCGHDGQRRFLVRVAGLRNNHVTRPRPPPRRRRQSAERPAGGGSGSHSLSTRMRAWRCVFVGLFVGRFVGLSDCRIVGVVGVVGLAVFVGAVCVRRLPPPPTEKKPEKAGRAGQGRVRAG